MKIIDKIFKYMGAADARYDVNKDVNGRGTVERYMRAFGDDIDTNIIPLIENLTKNLIAPYSMFSRYIDYYESDTDVPVISFDNDDSAAAEWYRRRILKHITKFLSIRGSRLGYVQLIQLIDSTAIITISEFFANYVYDSEFIYDDVAVYDVSICTECCKLSIVITTDSGSQPTAAVVSSLNSIIAFNLPVDVKIGSVTWNGFDIDTVLIPVVANQLSSEFVDGEFFSSEFL